MKTIWKFPVFYGDQQEIKMPENAKILALAKQEDYLYIWAEVDTTAQLTTRVFKTYSTGHPLDETSQVYVGTYQIQDGHLVHVYEQLSS